MKKGLVFSHFMAYTSIVEGIRDHTDTVVWFMITLVVVIAWQVQLCICTVGHTLPLQYTLYL